MGMSNVSEVSMKSVWLAAILLFCVISRIRGAKILGVFPVPARSHYILASSLMRALAGQGHDVTVVSPFEDKSPSANGTYRTIILTGFLEEMEVQRNQTNFFDRVDSFSFLMLFFINKMMIGTTENTLKHNNVQQLLNSKETFDVVIVEHFFNEAHLALASHFNAPLVVLSTQGTNSWINPLVGNPSPMSYIPEILLGYSLPMAFCERLTNSVFRLFLQLFSRYYVQPIHAQIAQKYLSSDLNNILRNGSLILLNSHPSLNQPVPTVPSLIEIGGFHIQPAQKLSADLQTFLDEAKQGVIYFSMGSNLKSIDLPVSKRDSLIKAFGKLKEQVLWKWESDDLPGKTENLKVGKWLPQQDILAHPNVKLFITHGGLLNTTEAVHYGVPILAIPVFGGQKMNARTAVNNGLGLMLEFGELNVHTLSNKLDELLHNPKYYNNAKARSWLYHDRQVKPMDKAIYWIEYVIRHKGVPHLRVAGLDLPWYKYFLVDVIAFVAILAGISLYVSLFIIRRICRRLRLTVKKNKANTEKEKRN